MGLNFFENGVLRNINTDDGIKINSFHKESIHKLEEKIFLTGYKNLQTFNPNEIKKFQSYNLIVGVLNITGYDDDEFGAPTSAITGAPPSPLPEGTS